VVSGWELAKMSADVAREVMGWTDVDLDSDGQCFCGIRPDQPGRGMHIPRYAQELISAWQVLEKLRQDGWLATVKIMPEGFPFRGDVRTDERFYAGVAVELMWMPQKTAQDCHRCISLRPFALGSTVPEVICKAALEAVRQLKRYA